MAYAELCLDLMKMYFILVCVYTFLGEWLCLLVPRSAVLGAFVKKLDRRKHLYLSAWASRVQDFWGQHAPEEFRRLLLTGVTTQERLGVEQERREKASFTVEAWGRPAVAISRKDQSSVLGTSTLSQLQKRKP